MKNAVMPLTDYQSACNIIREKTNSTDLIKSGDLCEKINSVFEKGEESQYDLFWDAYQENGQRNTYIEAFVRNGWNDITYNPKYDIVGQIYGLRSLFSNSGITDTKVNLIVRGGGDLRATFNMCTRLVRIPSLVLEMPVTDMGNAFSGCKNLEEITVSCVNDGCFATNFDISSATKLTHNSLISILNALKDLTQTGESFTATIGQANLDKLTDADKAIAFNKGWALA